MCHQLKKSCCCNCQKYTNCRAKCIALKKDGLKFRNIRFYKNVYKHLFKYGDQFYPQKPWGISEFYEAQWKEWKCLNKDWIIFQKNPFPKHFLNNGDFVAKSKCNRNRKAKRNAIKYHVLCFEKISSLSKMSHTTWSNIVKISARPLLLFESLSENCVAHVPN